MPTITINEKDLTSAGVNQSTSNAVFIPGYANIGPINVPTLCETVDDFKYTFGSTPYIFRVQQTVEETTSTDGSSATASSNGSITFNAGSYEQSYVYALEVLRRGMPVIYSRVFDEDKLETWSPTLDLSGVVIVTSKYPGSYYTDIKCVLTAADTTSKIPASLTITFGDSNDEYYVEEKFNIVYSIDELNKASETYPEYSVELCSNISSDLVDFDWTDNTTGLIYVEANPQPDSTNFNEATYYTKSNKTYSIANSYVSGTTYYVEADSVSGNLALSDKATGDEFIPDDIYNGLAGQLDLIEDKNEYQLKFITSGSYPTFGAANSPSQKLIDAAYERGDCVAIIDAFPNTNKTATATALQERVINKGFSYGEYGAMFTPCGYYTCSSIDSTLVMPASFGYLTAYATSIQSNAGWLAVAGATRGVASNLVSNIGPKITNAMVNELQGRATVSINPIMQVKPYGNLIWGNRTLKNNAIKNNLTAQSFLNIRCLLSEVKQVVYTTAKGLTFEQNSDILWINFKAGIVPTLDQMATGSGLSGYEIKRVSTTKKATLKAKIRLYAIEAIEDFEVDIELTDSEVTTTE